MDYTVTARTFDLSKQLVFGIGIGVGAGLVIKRLLNERSKHKEVLIYTLQTLIREVQHLREVLEQSTRSKGRISRAPSTRDVRRAEEESDDDDLFELAPSETGSDAGVTKGDSASESGRNSACETFLHEVAQLQDGNKDDQLSAYNLLLSRVYEFPGNCEVMWRFAKAQYDIATQKGKEGDREKQMSILKKGLEAAGKAIVIDDTSASAHKWYAILVGNFSEFQATQDKILMGYKYKEHIEKSIKLRDDDPSAHSLLGRWCYEVYMLPWYMRKAAGALYAVPPSSTVDEALEHFLKAENLKPGFWKANTLYIGKCYYQKSDYKEAKEWLLSAYALPCNREDDAQSNKEIEELLAKL